MAGKSKPRGSRRGWGSATQMASGNYRASYIDPVTKKRVYADTSFPYKAQADDWLARKRTEIIDGKLGKPKVDRTPFAEYAERWLTKRPKPFKPSTLVRYRSVLQHQILPTFGSMHLGDITEIGVSDWYDSLDVGQSTRALAYIVLTGIMKKAKREERITANPCQVEKGSATPKRRKAKETFGPREVAEIAEVVQPYYRAMIYVAMYGAMRFGELIGLQRGDIDLGTGAIHVNWQLQLIYGKWVRQSVKSESSERVLYLPQVVMDELAKHLANFVGSSPTAPVFTTARGNPPVNSAYNRMLRAAAKRIGRPDLDLTSHKFRKAGLTLYSRNGATLRETMEFGGHSDVEAAMVYQYGGHVRAQDLAKRMNGNVVLGKTDRPTSE